MIKFWRTWLYQLDPYTRILAAMLSTELQYVSQLSVIITPYPVCSGLNIRCKSDEFNVFDPPSGQTCLEWGREFVQSFGGYLDNPGDAQACRYCQYSVGDEFFLPLNIRFSERWRDAFILFSFFGEFRLQVLRPFN